MIQNMNKVHKMTLTAILAAIIFLLAFTPLGYLSIGPIAATTVQMPVIIGAALMGPTTGAVLGFFFGLSAIVKVLTMPGAEEAAYNVAMGVFSEVVGIYYGKTYFGEEARQDVQAMVEQIVDVYRQRLTENEWLSDETREMAIRKLDHMSIHVGYPDEARPMYALLKTVPASEGGTLVDNMMAYTRASAEYVLGLCGQPVDRREWPLSANTVNAMYTLTNNSINFPAAILQEPFYSLEQSASANYGNFFPP